MTEINGIDRLASWPDRERRWRRKLGRIRPGDGPVEEQLSRFRAMTWVMTAVGGGIALLFVALFSAFGKPLYGLVVAAVLPGPILIAAWTGYFRLRRRAHRYLEELREVEGLRLARSDR